MWLCGNKVGDKWICVGVLVGWVVGDKIGIGDYGMMNDVGVIWLMLCVLIVLVVYYM